MGRGPRHLLQIAFCFLLLAGCSKAEKPTGAARAAAAEQPEFVMSPFRIQSFGGTGLEWELRSPEARAYTSMNVMRAEEVDLTLFEQGQKSTTIRSDRGVFCIQSGPVSKDPVPVVSDEGYPLKAGDMLLKGNVVVVSTDGTKLVTDWLHYIKARDIIKSTAPVQIFRTDSITRGTGLEATPDLERVKVFNQTLVIKGDDEK